MTTTPVFILPAPSGEAVEIPRDVYDKLISKGGLTHRTNAIIVSAGQILPHLQAGRSQALREIIHLIRPEGKDLPTAGEKLAVNALVRAGFAKRIGQTKQTRYVLVEPTAL